MVDADLVLCPIPDQEKLKRFYADFGVWKDTVTSQKWDQVMREFFGEHHTVMQGAWMQAAARYSRKTADPQDVANLKKLLRLADDAIRQFLKDPTDDQTYYAMVDLRHHMTCMGLIPEVIQEL